MTSNERLREMREHVGVDPVADSYCAMCAGALVFTHKPGCDALLQEMWDADRG